MEYSQGRGLLLGLVFLAGLACFIANLSIGTTTIDLTTLVQAFVAFDDENYDHFILIYQRLPRALIALYVGAVMAVGGLVLQGLTRNPLAAPASLGINSGATMFVVIGAFLFDAGMQTQGMLALGGALFGFVSCLMVMKLTGTGNDPKGLPFILAGALTSMLFMGVANALLLSDPAKRTDFLSWVTGNINHVYADRLFSLWWIGLVTGVVLFYLSRQLTLITLGQEKATSIGVNVNLVSWVSLVLVMLAAGSAVAICGPVGFVGLVVPHIVRPIFGVNFRLNLPAAALMGGMIVLLADLVARKAFSPFVLHTGLVMDLLGGVVFAVIVRKYYILPRKRGAA